MRSVGQGRKERDSSECCGEKNHGLVLAALRDLSLLALSASPGPKAARSRPVARGGCPRWNLDEQRERQVADRRESALADDPPGTISLRRSTAMERARASPVSTRGGPRGRVELHQRPVEEEIDLGTAP